MLLSVHAKQAPLSWTRQGERCYGVPAVSTSFIPYHSPDVTAYLNDLLFTPDALLMGQKTYEFLATVWPTREGTDADRINSMPKYVASRT